MVIRVNSPPRKTPTSLSATGWSYNRFEASLTNFGRLGNPNLSWAESQSALGQTKENLPDRVSQGPWAEKATEKHDKYTILCNLCKE